MELSQEIEEANALSWSFPLLSVFNPIHSIAKALLIVLRVKSVV